MSKPDLDLLKLNDLKIESKKKEEEEEASADSYLSFEEDEKNKIRTNEIKFDERQINN